MHRIIIDSEKVTREELKKLDGITTWQDMSKPSDFLPEYSEDTEYYCSWQSNLGLTYVSKDELHGRYKKTESFNEFLTEIKKYL